MIIDFHTHCFPDELAPKAIKVLEGNAGIPANLNGTIGKVKDSMHKAGISRSVVLSIATNPAQTQKVNNWAAEIQDEEIIAFGSIHPDYDNWFEELSRIKKLGLAGIKFHPDYQNFFVDEPRMYPIYEAAFDLGLIIIFHAGMDIGLPAPYHCTPERLSKVLEAVPGDNFIAAHMGGYSYWDDVEKFLVGKDIYFDTSFSFGHINSEQVERIILNHGYNKILFATDSPWTVQDKEVKEFKKSRLEGHVQKAILFENAQRLLRIEN